MVEISYNGFQLNEAPYKIQYWEGQGSPTRNSSLLNLARGHGSKRTYDSFNSRRIYILGQIICGNSTELENAIDELKRQLRKSEGQLSIDYAGNKRVWTATPSNIAINRMREHISYTPFSVDFECENPFGTDQNYDVYIDDITVEDALQNLFFVAQGSMDIEPVIELNIVECDPDNAVREITVANINDNEYLAISDVFLPGDNIVIDCKQKTVFKNGIFMPAKGQFPVLPAGSVAIQYSDTFSSREIRVNIGAERRYL